MVLKALLTYNNIFIQNPQFKSSGGTQILNFFRRMNGSPNAPIFAMPCHLESDFGLKQTWLRQPSTKIVIRKNKIC